MERNAWGLSKTRHWVHLNKKTMFSYSMLQKYLWKKKKDSSGLRHNIPFSNVNDKEKSLFVSKVFYNQYDHVITSKGQFISLIFNYIQRHFLFLPFLFFPLHVLCYESNSWLIHLTIWKGKKGTRIATLLRLSKVASFEKVVLCQAGHTLFIRI